MKARNAKVQIGSKSNTTKTTMVVVREYVLQMRRCNKDIELFLRRFGCIVRLSLEVKGNMVVRSQVVTEGRLMTRTGVFSEATKIATVNKLRNKCLSLISQYTRDGGLVLVFALLPCSNYPLSLPSTE